MMTPDARQADVEIGGSRLRRDDESPAEPWSHEVVDWSIACEPHLIRGLE